MSRRTARELAFKLLFQLEIQKDDTDEQIRLFIEENNVEYNDLEDNEINEKDRDYIENIVKGIISNLKEIDENVEKHLKGWKFNRISKVDLSILRLSIFEILNRQDIPSNVSINEAVEIAKKYGNEDSGAFVNGILGKFVRARAVPNMET